MKQINPITNTFYKRGDIREDGYVFWSYRTSDKKKDGFFRTYFISPKKWKDSSERRNQKVVENQKRFREKILQKKVLKEKKPDGSDWQFGDFHNGMYFRAYSSNQIKKGFQSGVWLTPESWHKANVRGTFQRTRDRTKKSGIKWDIDIDYLLSIFPDDFICPILNIKMEWAGERSNSPSLDRLVPEKGYVEGNIFWISWKANMIKSIGTSKEHRMIANWMDKNKIMKQTLLTICLIVFALPSWGEIIK